MLRRVLLAALLVLLAGAAALYWYMRPLPILTVTSWAGAYGRAQAAAQMRPYASGHRVDVRIAEWDGTLKDMKGDVIDFELPKAVEACHRGLLEKIDTSSLPPGQDGTPAAKDFVPGAIGPCWVGSVVYSQVIITGKFPGAQPVTLADFFDTGKFPGRRVLKRGSGKYNLEMALLADGVTDKDVYPLLATDAGVKRAIAKLQSLGGDLVWYNSDAEGLALLESGRACFRHRAQRSQVFDAAQRDKDLSVIWDHQLYEMEAFGVPRNDAQKDRAMDYIRFATGTAPLAGVASWVPYGPARRSSWALVGKNPQSGEDMRPLLPTSHFDTAFAVDEEWWRVHGDKADAAWAAWAH